MGLLGADLARSASRTRVLRLSEDGLAEAGRIAGELFAELDARGSTSARHAIREVHVDIRFVGQEHTLTVPVPTRAGAVEVDPDPVAERFLDEYERAFAAVLDEEIEIVCVRSIATAPLDRDAVPAASGNGRIAEERRGTVRAWSFTSGEHAEFAVVDRAGLPPEAELVGPAIVREQTATTYVDRGFRATVHAGGALLIERAATQ